MTIVGGGVVAGREASTEVRSAVEQDLQDPGPRGVLEGGDAVRAADSARATSGRHVDAAREQDASAGANGPQREPTSVISSTTTRREVELGLCRGRCS